MPEKRRTECPYLQPPREQSVTFFSAQLLQIGHRRSENLRADTVRFQNSCLLILYALTESTRGGKLPCLQTLATRGFGCVSVAEPSLTNGAVQETRHATELSGGETLRPILVPWVIRLNRPKEGVTTAEITGCSPVTKLMLVNSRRCRDVLVLQRIGDETELAPRASPSRQDSIICGEGKAGSLSHLRLGGSTPTYSEVSVV